MGSSNSSKKSFDEYKKTILERTLTDSIGFSLASISAITDTSINTIAKLRQLVKEDMM